MKRSIRNLLPAIVAGTIQNHPRPHMQSGSGTTPMASPFKLRFIYLTKYNLNRQPRYRMILSLTEDHTAIAAKNNSIN